MFAALRWRELTASVAELGVTDVRYLGLADGECHLADDDVMTRRILEVIEETRPEAVITFGPDGITGHPDHRAVSRWTTAAWNRSDRAADLLYAAMTEEFMDRNDELHRRLGLFAEYGAPPQPLPRSAVALGCTLNPDELERKRTALARHASQTTALATAVGEDAYHHWWRDETFRKGPAADARTSIGRPFGLDRDEELSCSTCEQHDQTLQLSSWHQSSAGVPHAAGVAPHRDGDEVLDMDVAGLAQLGDLEVARGYEEPEPARMDREPQRGGQLEGLAVDTGEVRYPSGSVSRTVRVLNSCQNGLSRPPPDGGEARTGARPRRRCCVVTAKTPSFAASRGGAAGHCPATPRSRTGCSTP